MANEEILWLDNDPGQMHGLRVALERSNFKVILTTSVHAAENLLNTKHFALVILDVMIPINDAEETAGYTNAITDDSHRTGLAFYRKHKVNLRKQGGLMVFTVRVDKEIRDEFVSAGLPASSFVTKLELRDAKDFVEHVKKQMRGNV